MLHRISKPLVSTKFLSSRVSQVRCQAEMSTLGWTKQDTRRPLTASYYVNDLEAHIDYYTKLFGMKLLRKQESSDGTEAKAHLGFGPEASNFTVEINSKKGVSTYDLGTGFGHFGLAIPDVYATVASIKAADGKVTRDAGPVKGGNTVIAFVEDGTGYKWELIQRESTPEPLCQVMLRVGDLDKSIAWYRSVLGMDLIRTRDNPDYKYTLGFMGYGPEESNAVIELTYNYGTADYTMGNAYQRVVLATKDVYKTAKQIQEAGGVVTQGPGPLPGSSVKAVETQDPDGWKFMFVDEQDYLQEAAAAP